MDHRCIGQETNNARCHCTCSAHRTQTRSCIQQSQGRIRIRHCHPSVHVRHIRQKSHSVFPRSLGCTHNDPVLGRRCHVHCMSSRSIGFLLGRFVRLQGHCLHSHRRQQGGQGCWCGGCKSQRGRHRRHHRKFHRFHPHLLSRHFLREQSNRRGPPRTRPPATRRHQHHRRDGKRRLSQCRSEFLLLPDEQIQRRGECHHQSHHHRQHPRGTDCMCFQGYQGLPNRGVLLSMHYVLVHRARRWSRQFGHM